ncbi:MAG: isoaspartyl peptidase/L-asparaginase [Puniceicoccaceae bacterium]|nr:MAG: isoaspartyl peptidase/L-asparaginase [Puniceicoccaceae bacterium]
MDPVLVLHGGAGALRAALERGLEEEPFHQALRNAAAAGWAILTAGGAALDAVEAAVVSLEDDPCLNAGRGSVLNQDGVCEMDAALVCGRTGRAGAVAAVTGIRNPIRLARAVYEANGPVLLAGAGACAFARAHGTVTAPPEYFHVDRRLRQWREARARNHVMLDHGETGTVGAVALDRAGRLAAATSTGGLTNKLPGRVGDTPLIGAGTFADHRCAVSCTGTGEAFIRTVAAHNLAARLRWSGTDLERAARAAIHEDLAAAGGSGGLIAVGADGAVALPYNSEGMIRAVARAGQTETALF